MPDPSRYYLLGAFLLGVAVTGAWAAQKSRAEAEPELSKRRLKQYKKHLSHVSKIKDADILQKTLAELAESLEKGIADVKEGIEGCIGDTPLIKIKSLSEATGCEILAKAEVCIALAAHILQS